MIEVVRAEGSFITDAAGKHYIDFISGISVSNVGHRHPEVIRAIEDQLGRYMHVMVYGEYIQGPQVLLARELADVLPPSLDTVYFVNSGSEAVEGALKLAKRATGRTEIISFRNAYHGSTHGALSVMGNEYFRQAYRPLIPGVQQLPFNDVAELQRISDRTAAVICEPIQGEAGVIVPDDDWLRELRAACSKTGTLLIFDEIQTGFGRSGHLFAFEHSGVVPDVLVLAKGMGGGLPIGAFIASAHLMKHLSHDPVLGHITTFGGNAVCCAASRAVLSIVLNQELHTRALECERRIRRNFSKAAFRVRGRGLLLAAEFDSREMAGMVLNNCMNAGLITDWFLFADYCLRIAPPLTISDSEIDRACEILLKACE